MKENKTHYRKRMPPEYKIWEGIRSRCRCPSDNAYKHYGGRGIWVCDRWGSFALFYKDMGSRPSVKHQIDRIDNDGGYCPENCRWILRQENCRNRSSTRLDQNKASKIRAIYALGGISTRALGKEFGVSKTQIRRILKNEQWVA